MKPRHHCPSPLLAGLALGLCLSTPAFGQVDQALSRAWFAEANALCQWDGGKLWGISLCGPMAFVDAPTGTIATSEPAPTDPRPGFMGYANTAVEWGGQRWATYIWSGIPADDRSKRARLLMHELFHRVQPQLGLMTNNGANGHLDTFDGRLWMRLEWRALSRAVGQTGAARAAAISDALAFRAARRRAVPSAAEDERADEIREGLAQYTGTMFAVDTPEDAVANVVQQLEEAESQPTFVRTFAYPSGAAYGLLLDAFAPGWTRQVTGSSDLADMLVAASGIAPAADPQVAMQRYDGAALRAVEMTRETERLARVAELTARYVDGPVLVFPRPNSASFTTTGATPIPGHGTVYLGYRTSGDWGSFETTTGVLVPDEFGTLVVPAPPRTEGSTISGPGWTLTLNPGWTIHPGPRPGDFRVGPTGSSRPR